MKLTERFKRLTLWNKLGVLGAVASIIALVVAVATFFLPKSDGTTNTSTANSKAGPAVAINEIRDSTVVIGPRSDHTEPEKAESENDSGSLKDGSSLSTGSNTDITFVQYIEERRRREDLTSLQKEQFFKHYVGKRVNWIGYVRGVEERGDDVVISIEPKPESGIFDVARCEVQAADKSRFMTLSKGQKLRVTGTLTDRFFYGYVVDDCEVKQIWALGDSLKGEEDADAPTELDAGPEPPIRSDL